MFWIQTPRVNWSALKGAVRRERREYERTAVASKWTGLLAQVDPNKQPSVDKLMGVKKPRRAMSGGAIESAMIAWAAATCGSA